MLRPIQAQEERNGVGEEWSPSGLVWPHMVLAGANSGTLGTAMLPGCLLFPRGSFGLLPTSSSTSGPVLGALFSIAPPIQCCLPRDEAAESQQRFCHMTGEALGCRDQGFGCQWGKPCSALAFHPFSWLKDSEHSRHSRRGPHQLAAVCLGVLGFLHQSDQETGGSRVVPVGGFTSVPSRCQRLLPNQVPTPLLQTGEWYFLSLL